MSFILVLSILEIAISQCLVFKLVRYEARGDIKIWDRNRCQLPIHNFLVDIRKNIRSCILGLIVAMDGAYC